METVTNDNRPRVAWLCGSLEPGRDGVGDYVRTVSRELERSGGEHRHAVVALRDGWVEDVAAESGALRLPANWSAGRVARAAEDHLAGISADVLAWNFVPQMFAPRGIISAEVAAEFSGLREGRRLILFFHELWCGTGRPDTLRNWMLGAIQRPGVLRWIEFHQPDLVLTSNPAYAAVLQHFGVTAEVVPLCSNIPRHGDVDRANWPEVLASTAMARDPRAAWLLAGVFGAIHPVWEPAEALTELDRFARETGRRLAVVWFGQGSPAATEIWRGVVGALESSIHFECVGPVDEYAASVLLRSCDLGLPTIQFNLLGKSGTAAAFREHGVPLLIVSDAWTPRFSGFVPRLPDPATRLWLPGGTIDWGRLLSTRPAAGGILEECLAGWRNALGRVLETVVATSAG